MKKIPFLKEILRDYSFNSYVKELINQNDCSLVKYNDLNKENIDNNDYIIIEKEDDITKEFYEKYKNKLFYITKESLNISYYYVKNGIYINAWDFKNKITFTDMTQNICFSTLKHEKYRVDTFLNNFTNDDYVKINTKRLKILNYLPSSIKILDIVSLTCEWNVNIHNSPNKIKILKIEDKVYLKKFSINCIIISINNVYYREDYKFDFTDVGCGNERINNEDYKNKLVFSEITKIVNFYPQDYSYKKDTFEAMKIIMEKMNNEIRVIKTKNLYTKNCNITLSSDTEHCNLDDKWLIGIKEYVNTQANLLWEKYSESLFELVITDTTEEDEYYRTFDDYTYGSFLKNVYQEYSEKKISLKCNMKELFTVLTYATK